MSRRYEYAGPDTPVEIVPPDAGEDSGLELDDGHHALVIGDPWSSAYAIEGTPEGIRAFAARVAELVEAGLPRAISPAGDEQLAAWLEAACPDGPGAPATSSGRWKTSPTSSARPAACSTSTPRPT